MTQSDIIYFYYYFSLYSKAKFLSICMKVFGQYRGFHIRVEHAKSYLSGTLECRTLIVSGDGIWPYKVTGAYKGIVSEYASIPKKLEIDEEGGYVGLVVGISNTVAQDRF